MFDSKRSAAKRVSRVASVAAVSAAGANKARKLPLSSATAPATVVGPPAVPEQKVETIVERVRRIRSEAARDARLIADKASANYVEQYGRELEKLLTDEFVKNVNGTFEIDDGSKYASHIERFATDHGFVTTSVPLHSALDGRYTGQRYRIKMPPNVSSLGNA